MASGTISERSARRLLAKIERVDSAGFDATFDNADKIPDLGHPVRERPKEDAGILVDGARDRPGAADVCLYAAQMEMHLGTGCQMVPESTWMA